MRIAILVIAIAAGLSMPVASAYVDVCWDTVGACAFSWSGRTGDGMCDAGATHGEYRMLRASWTNDNVTRTIEVDNDCSAYASDSTHEESSALRIHETEYNASSQRSSWTWIDWSGTDSNTTASTCEMRVWSDGNTAIPDGSTSEPCPDGRPPLVLQTLP